MINDENIGQKFNVIIPHPHNRSMLNVIVVGDRFLMKDDEGFYFKWLPSKFARDGKLRDFELAQNGNIIVNVV